MVVEVKVDRGVCCGGGLVVRVVVVRIVVKEWLLEFRL